MKIGVIKEIVNREYRVALNPEGTKSLVDSGHTVLVQEGAGLGAGFTDGEYLGAGAHIVPVKKAWDAELITKVKQPLESEYQYIKNQTIFTYFHLAGVSKKLTEVLIHGKATSVAYETVENKKRELPLLAPMSAVAGNMAVTVGNYYLAHFKGGKGVQLGNILGKSYGKVVVIGDGIVGRHAAGTAAAIGARVFIAGRHKERFADLRQKISKDINCFISEPARISRHLEDADLVVGAVLQRGARAPYIITEAMIKLMEPGSVIVDVSIDQGGCVETSRPTSHDNPVFKKHNVIHYCVINMPGAYPRTSTLALTSATLPYILKLSNKGIAALREDKWFGKGVNTYRGHITCEPVARAHDMVKNFREFSDINE
jgi:alanine dehydrogenase